MSDDNTPREVEIAVCDVCPGDVVMVLGKWREVVEVGYPDLRSSDQDHDWNLDGRGYISIAPLQRVKARLTREQGAA